MDKTKQPGLTIRLNEAAAIAFQKYKEELERQLAMPLNTSQTIIYITNAIKEKK